MVAKETAEESPADTSFFPDEGDEGHHDESSKALVNAGEPDVLLEAPEVNVERISIETEHLRTGVSVFARVGNFVALEVGANAQLDNVSIKMRGVRAQGKVKVHLQKVYAIILRTLASIDRKPELLAGGEKPMPQLGTAIGKDAIESEHAVESEAAPDVDKPGKASLENAAAPVGKAVADAAEKARVGKGAGTVEKAKGVVGKGAGTIEKAKGVVGKSAGTTEKAADTLKKAMPSVKRAAEAVTEKAEEATRRVTEGDGQHGRTERVLRPIKHAAHEVADKVRLAITMAKVAASTHRATRAPRRAAKASGHVTKRVLHPDVPGLKRK